MQVAIIGGGLAGLALGRHLQRAGADFQLFEARARFGGRIDALRVPGGAVDLGPSWFWPGQPRMAALLKDLKIASFEQFAHGAACYEDDAGRVHMGRGYASMAGALRVKGGVSALIDALADQLPQDRLHLSSAVWTLGEDGRITLGDGSTAQAETIVLALPPRIAAGLSFAPGLPQGARTAMAAIPTWMAGHAKFTAVYDAPFWRANGLSGDAVSARGPLAEIHDASGRDGTPAALFGFVGVRPQDRAGWAADITEAALDQLARIFGEAARRPLTSALTDWATAPETATTADHAPLRAHPAYGLPAALRGLWGGKLHFASSEVAPEAGGLMEGALAAAGHVAALVATP